MNRRPRGGRAGTLLAVLPPTDPDPTASAPFPREHLTDLLSEAEAARLRRERLQGWLIGIGLAVLALGLPSERLWGDMRLVRMTAGSGEISSGILFPLAALLTRIEGIGPEQACFLLAALAYGLIFPATLRLLRGIGFEHGIAMSATAVAVLTPVLWLGATQPVGFTPGALGATLLLATLFRPRERLRSGYQWRAVTLFFLAFLLAPENVLLLPAVVWAAVRHGGRARGPVAGLTLALVGVFVVQILISGHAPTFWDAVLAGRSPSWSALPLWALYLVAGLGVSGLGLYALLLDRRLPEETPAPVWMVPWCLVALAPVAAGTPAAGPVGGFLVPAAAVGVADWLTRREGEHATRRAAVVSIATQLVLAGAVWVAWDGLDPAREERATLRRLLEPEDVVVTEDPTLRYLCRHRYGLLVASGLEDLPADARERAREGAARIVLWSPPDTAGVLHETAPVHVREGDEVERVPAGQVWRP